MESAAGPGLESDGVTERDHDKTPRVSGSYGRWPLFRDTARMLIDACERQALRCEKVLEEIDIRKARRLAEIGSTARALEEAFAAWEFGDPGVELRSKAVNRLFDLRAHAKELGVDVDAPFERTGA